MIIKLCVVVSTVCLLNASDYSQDEADMAFAFGQEEYIPNEYQKFSPPSEIEVMYDSAELASEDLAIFQKDVQDGLNKADVGLSPAVNSTTDSDTGWVLRSDSDTSSPVYPIKFQKIKVSRPASTEPIKTVAVGMFAGQRLSRSG